MRLSCKINMINKMEKILDNFGKRTWKIGKLERLNGVHRYI